VGVLWASTWMRASRSMVDELGLGAVEAMPCDGGVVDDTGRAVFMGSRGLETIPWPAAGHDRAGQGRAGQSRAEQSRAEQSRADTYR
jgi:hypothetical protein